MAKSIDDADLKLIRELSKDGRVSISRLAEKTGLSYTAVRKRILRLMERGYLGIKPVISSKLVGNRAAFIKIKTSNPDKIANILAKCNRVLGLFINHEGVSAMFYSRDKTELSAIISRVLAIDDHIEEYYIEYGRIPSTMMIPIRNPYPDCFECMYYQLKLCSGCLPQLRLKGNRNRNSNSGNNRAR